MLNKIIIGTRRSKLALKQTDLVKEMLQTKFPDLEIEIKEIVTEGDKNLQDSLVKLGGKGVFVKEIEKELMDKTIDIAVHSLKDVMPVLPSGLTLGAFPKRANPYDCMITHEPYESLTALPLNSRIGTNSTRRASQLLAKRPDFEIVPIRGNVETRLKKLTSENLNGVVLAKAGLERLGLDLSSYAQLDLDDVIVPAVGQGIMTIECRKDNQAILAILAEINDTATQRCAQIEREFMRELGGNCTFPIGGFARQVGEELIFSGLIASLDGKHVLRKSVHHANGYGVGKRVADQLLAADTYGIIEGK
ncbi:hydroxymethylbilane synthase [Lactobacillus sp. 3B(2020)]|uniref:hydroxymethylbilane synthase n=1 Tax=Lactobacillus sp. 3B(2020) TaxID=2695882 RepID=UPI0015E00588|nr:hydroxymethylbilane synthase [Lactobacillus sp. 3B(2020)]QLL69186.1 hydroxymethylbilane synthase [Lactobacillus sp. 3B(2020)]